MESITSNTYYNVNSTHPLIQNAQEYIVIKKYVSIHSEDRDFTKFPNSSDFEIEMPEDMVNVQSLRLINWTFPANYNTFSGENNNVTMTFTLNKPYDPNVNGLTDLLTQKTYEALYYNKEHDYVIIIGTGFYNPDQMVTELTNRFNYAVTSYIKLYFTQKSTDMSLTLPERQEYVQALLQFNALGGYTNFVIVYNNVAQNIWFGNISDGFILTNENQIKIKNFYDNKCYAKDVLPDYYDQGLPGCLGLPICNNTAISGSDLPQNNNYTNVNGVIVPRFYYGDVSPGDNGYWLLPNPNLPNSQVYWVEAIYKINLMGPAYLYMEIAGNNCIDETSPYNISTFTVQNNETNGRVNSAFAKLSVPTTPISQWFDREAVPYKWYLPVAERIRRLRIRVRYHNGQLASFGVFNYSFMLEFTLQSPQILRSSKLQMYNPSRN